MDLGIGLMMSAFVCLVMDVVACTLLHENLMLDEHLFVSVMKWFTLMDI